MNNGNNSNNGNRPSMVRGERGPGSPLRRLLQRGWHIILDGLKRHAPGVSRTLDDLIWYNINRSRPDWQTVKRQPALVRPLFIGLFLARNLLRLFWHLLLVGLNRLSPALEFRLNSMVWYAMTRCRQAWLAAAGRPLPWRLVVFVFIFISRTIKTVINRLSQFDMHSGIRVLLHLYFPLTLSIYLLNQVLVRVRRNVKYPNSVLHISYMVHIPFYMTRTLRRQGIKADYLAVRSESPWWKKCDYRYPLPDKPANALEEFLFFWRVVARYEVIHSHFGIMFSETGWELPLLKKMGRKIVVHYRGCEARDPALNQQLHPQSNICQDCDYKGSVCRDGRKRMEISQKFGDEFLVTTPDMKDFQPEALHFPFFLPEIDYEKYKAPEELPADQPFRIVHVTNHPGIEGTRHIQAAIDRLKSRGYAIDFQFLRGVSPERALEAYRDAHLSIGKMKMGYYANAQIESMYLGVPAITYVRPEFMTPELESSGLIFSTLERLEETIEYYFTHPEALAQKRARARSSILELHSEERLTALLMQVYGMKAPAKNGLPAPVEKRVPRVLFIGNTANNAYYNAKFLRRSGAAEVDVLCNDDYWIMSTPEWEEADFKGMVDHHFYPDWKSVDLRGYERPRWFAQGTYRTAVEYLTAYRQGDSRRAALLWKELELERQMANAKALKSKREQSRLTWRWRLHLLRTLLTGNLWDRLFVSPLSEDFIRHCEALTERFRQRFPDRPDSLTVDELSAYQDKIKFLVELLPHYDIIQAYAVEPILPMLADFHPYIGFEHGTLRDAPEANWDFKGPFYPNRIGRLTALGYALADHVFVTNEDCISSAKRLDLKSYSLIPHPVDEQEGFFPTDEFRSQLLAEMKAEVVFLCPIRHDWVDKGTDVYIRILPRLRQLIGRPFKVVFTMWGREIEASKALIRELGCEDLVEWQGPFGRVSFVRMLASVDLVFDQLVYSAFSGLTPRAMACGTPVISGYDPADHTAFFAEPAPVLLARTEDEIVAEVMRALEPGFRESYRKTARAWIEKYHSSELVVTELTSAYRKVLPAPRSH